MDFHPYIWTALVDIFIRSLGFQFGVHTKALIGEVLAVEIEFIALRSHRLGYRLG